MSLILKYRPETFDEVYGEKNREMLPAMEALIAGDDPPHAWLMTGPTGCGKTTIGRIVTRTLGVHDLDFKEIDSADFRGIDTVRELRRSSGYKAMKGTRRAWLIDECHRQTRDAQEGLLKLLEEPPEHCFYVLCTTAPDSLLPTLRGRCSAFAVSVLQEAEMVRFLHRIATREGGELPRPALKTIAEYAQGHIRNALSMLEKVLAEPESGLKSLVTAEELKSQALDLCQKLVGRQGGWVAIRTILASFKEQGHDPENIRRSVMGYASAALMRGENDVAALVLDKFAAPFYDTGFPGLVFACYCVHKGE